jgi:arylsulfatase A-like enzyme
MRAHSLYLLTMGLLCACRERPGPSQPIDFGDVPTDTFPQFYGRVPKNLLMISMDTFRRDYLAPYAQDGGHAPFLSQVAELGVRLDDHVQCSNWTYASTSCTLAGRHNEEAGMIPQLVMDFDETWPVGTPFLASHLQEAGFYSVIASSNGWLSPEWGNTGGYDVAFHPTAGSAYEVYESGRERLNVALQQGKERWFLHLHLTEPHAAYSPPEEYLEGLSDLPPVAWDLDERDAQYDARELWPTMTVEERELLEQHLVLRYQGEIEWLDYQIFQIIAQMDLDGLLDDTLVVFWTDHGEAFWEHGYQTHAYTLNGEETDGLMFFWSKNVLPAVWEGPTQSTDLVPTLLSLYGLPVPPEITGVPVGQASEDRTRFMNSIARLGGLSAVQQGDYKLVFSWATGLVRLFDRSTDPTELVNLYDPEFPHPMAVEMWPELREQVLLQSSVVPDYTIRWPDELSN